MRALILVLPEGADATWIPAPQAARALRRVAGYGRREAVHGGVLVRVLEAVGQPHAAVGPLLALGAGVPSTALRAYTAAATPVRLVIVGDDVRVAARVQCPSIDYVAAAMDVFGDVFAEDGLRFTAPRLASWFVHAAVAPNLITQPLALALGESLDTNRPVGGDAPRWGRYANEMEMLLFALNERMPGANPETLPNGVWLWGGGSAGTAWGGSGVRAHVDATDTRETADLVRGIAIAQGSTPVDVPADFDGLRPASGAQAHEPPRSTNIVLPGAATADAWIDAAVAALERHTLVRLTVILDGTPSLAWTAAAPSRWQRLRARLGAQPAAGIP